MKKNQFACINSTRSFGLLAMSMVVTLSLSIAGASLPGEHPEHPTKGAKKEAVAQQAASGVLDGRSFTGEMGESGNVEGNPDDLVFNKGQFVSSMCRNYGFSETAYSTSEKNGVVSFSAKATNAEKETMSWTGTISGDDIVAKAVYQTGAKQTVYWYKGRDKTVASATSEHPKKVKKSEHPKKDKKSEHPK